MTSTTTAPAFTHTADCTDQFIGRSLRIERDSLLLSAPVDSAAPLDLINYIMEEARQLQDQLCVDCAKLALLRVDDQLRIARKQYRNRPKDRTPSDYRYRDGLVAEIDALIAKRDAIRAAIAQ
jgi:hypothetical protein